jgi:hypothetical protein
MGVSCASEIFTEAIRKILEQCPGQTNMTDDVLVFSGTIEEHTEHLNQVLEALEEAGVTLNIDKCQFYRMKLTFFGLTFSSEGIAPIEDRVASIRNAVSLAELEKQQETDQYINLITESAVPMILTRAQITEATKKDVELVKLKEFIRTRHSPTISVPESLKAYANIIEEVNSADDEILLRGQRIIVPRSLRNLTVDLAHTGHQGIVKTKTLIRSHVWFPGIDGLVERKVTRCLSCQTNAPKQYYEPLRPSRMPEGPWRNVSGDFFGPMSDGAYWFVNYDKYSRWVSVHLIKTVKGDKVIPVLEELFTTFGVPAVYKTDNGSPFQSHEFAAFVAKWGFKHRRVTPLWPRANGEVESFMKQLGKVIRIAEASGRKREDALRDFLRVYRATPHSTTKIAPAILMMGHSHTAGIPSNPRPDLTELHRQVVLNDGKAKERMRKEYNRRMKAQEPCFKVGDSVLAKLAKINKTTPRWDNIPYSITSINGSMITVSRPDHQMTRNSSCFKEYIFDDDDTQNNVTSSCAEREEPSDTATPTLDTTISTSHILNQPTAPGPNTPTTPPVTTAPATASSPPRKRGRPTKIQEELNKLKAVAKENARRLANQPTHAMRLRETKRK